MTSSLLKLADRYRLGAVLGRGGMSDVHRAIDERTGVAVAVKLARSGDEELASRFAREVQVLGRFEHPGLVRLLDAGVVGEQAYLVMELVEGPTLAQRLRQGPLDAATVAGLGSTLAGVLAHVHRCGVVHRDVKPANVLLQGGVEPKLADFGIARLIDDPGETVAGTMIGTAAYMAPEQLENHRVGPAADIWSLGIVLVECLAGCRVYEGTASEVIGRRLAGPVPLAAGVSGAWRVLLRSMLEERPDKRLVATEAARLLASPALRDSSSEAGLPTGTLAAAAARPRPRSSGRARPGPARATTGPPQRLLAPRPARPPVTDTLRALWAHRENRPWLFGTAAVVATALVLAAVLGNGSGLRKAPTATHIAATPPPAVHVHRPKPLFGAPSTLPTTTPTTAPSAAAAPSTTAPPATAAPSTTALTAPPAAVGSSTPLLPSNADDPGPDGAGHPPAASGSAAAQAPHGSSGQDHPGKKPPTVPGPEGHGPQHHGPEGAQPRHDH